MEVEQGEAMEFFHGGNSVGLWKVEDEVVSAH